MRRFLACSLLAVGLSACAVSAPARGIYYVPPDLPQVCSQHCGTMGMALGEVVLVGNAAGCVCHLTGAAETAGAAGGTAAAVTAVHLAAEEEAAAAQQQNQTQMSTPRH